MTHEWKCETSSRFYNLLMKAMLRNRFSDAQCGSKAAKRDMPKSSDAHPEHAYTGDNDDPGAGVIPCRVPDPFAERDPRSSFCVTLGIPSSRGRMIIP